DVVVLQPWFVFFEMMRMSFGDDLEDRPVGGQRHVLFKPRDAQTGLPPDGTAGSGIRRQLAADDFEKSRLAAAIASDDRHALARVHLQRRFVQERQMAKRDRHAVKRKKRHDSPGCSNGALWAL